MADRLNDATRRPAKARGQIHQNKQEVLERLQRGGLNPQHLHRDFYGEGSVAGSGIGYSPALSISTISQSGTSAADVDSISGRLVRTKLSHRDLKTAYGLSERTTASSRPGYVQSLSTTSQAGSAETETRREYPSQHLRTTPVVSQQQTAERIIRPSSPAYAQSISISNDSQSQAESTSTDTAPVYSWQHQNFSALASPQRARNISQHSSSSSLYSSPNSGSDSSIMSSRVPSLGSDNDTLYEDVSEASTNNAVVLVGRPILDVTTDGTLHRRPVYECTFWFIRCDYESHDKEEWFMHCASHFRGFPKPKSAICPICPTERIGDTYVYNGVTSWQGSDAWDRRMAHIAHMHHELMESVKPVFSKDPESRAVIQVPGVPDPNLYKFLWNKKIIATEDLHTLNSHHYLTEKPARSHTVAETSRQRRGRDKGSHRRG